MDVFFYFLNSCQIVFEMHLELEVMQMTHLCNGAVQVSYNRLFQDGVLESVIIKES